MAELDILSKLSELGEEQKLSPEDYEQEVQKIAGEYNFRYDPENKKFTGPDGKTRDLLAANKQVADLSEGKTSISGQDLSEIMGSKDILEFTQNVFGDASESQLGEKMLEERIKQKVNSSSSAIELDKTGKDNTALIKDAQNGRANPVTLENVLDKSTKSTLDTAIKNVGDMNTKITELTKKMDKAIASSFEDRKALTEIEKTLKDKGDKIQELADKTTAEMKKDGTWKDTAGKALMVLLASFIAYVSIDKLVDEMSGCFVTTKKDGIIVSKCKLADFTCCDPEQKKDGIYLLCNNLGDFYDSSSTNETCLDKDKKIYKDDGYFKANVCTGDGNGTDNGGMCKSCNSTNPCLTKNGTDNGDKITYEYTCVKADAMSALGFIMGGLINLVKDTTTGVFTAKWLWYVLFIAAGIMGVYLVFEFLKAYILSRAEKSA
jgi:hypothetical protein